MPQELSVDFLVVSRQADPPTQATVTQAVSNARLGALDYTAGAARSPGASTGRQRLGVYTLTSTTAPVRARISIDRHENAVTDGMGETAFATLTRTLDAESVSIVRDGRLGLSARLTANERGVAQALPWMMQVLRTLLDTLDSVVIDPACQRCYSRADLARNPFSTPAAHVAIHTEAWGAERLWLHTHGLQKMGRPEVDLVDVPHALEAEAATFLQELTGKLATGASLAPGQEILDDEAGILVAVGITPDMDHQAPFGRLRLADGPAPGERQGAAATRFLINMALADAARRAAAGDMTRADEIIDRILAAAPDDCATLALKAKMELRSGRPLEALQLGELMEMHAPGDHRGPLLSGSALVAIGRYREALRALNRAIDRDPESAEAFALRAEAHARLGQERLAAEDRAHAAYFRG